MDDLRAVLALGVQCLLSSVDFLLLTVLNVLCLLSGLVPFVLLALDLLLLKFLFHFVMRLQIRSEGLDDGNSPTYFLV